MGYVRVSPGVYKDTATGKVIKPAGGKTPTIPGTTTTPVVKDKPPTLQDTGTEDFGAASSAYLEALKNFGDGGRDKAYNSTYAHFNQYNDQDKAKEIEDKKQELINRGIPEQYSNDPNHPTVWEQAMGNINRTYDAKTEDAQNRAQMAGTDAYNSSVNALGVLGQSAGGFLGTLSQDQLSRLGLSQNQMLELKKIELEKQKIAKIGSGGSGGGGGDNTSPIFGGDAP